MLRVFNNTARYVDQGGNKRPGAFAIYIEPWVSPTSFEGLRPPSSIANDNNLQHADVFDFIDLRKNHGKEEVRARELFYALWIPDLFMRRVESNGDWPLFCPHEAPGLAEVWGEEFERLFEQYESEGRAKRVVKAQKLWYAVLESQIETGGPFMLYKDSANREYDQYRKSEKNLRLTLHVLGKSNQQNLGTIKSSNLCTEIIEYSAPDETAVCNLASIALPTFIRQGIYDFQKLHDVTRAVARNLNRIIDINFYPVKEARNSNMRHRPIGIGVQGLADAFMAMRMPFDSPEARQLNKQIHETIYHAALEVSCELAQRDGAYESFQGSPISKGQLQFDMWGVQPSELWDWEPLREKIQAHGVRNSLLVAPMPTASTSQILGNNECFEPYTSNIYARRVLAGEFQIVNPWLLRDLVDLGIWDDDLKQLIIAHHGSIQNIPNIPAELKAIYKTVWEISQKAVIDMAADRGAFICQSQSLNIHLSSPTLAQLTSMHFYAFKKGLKTGMYYLRTRPAVGAIQFTVSAETLKTAKSQVKPASQLTTQAPLPKPAPMTVNGAGAGAAGTPPAVVTSERQPVPEIKDLKISEKAAAPTPPETQVQPEQQPSSEQKPQQAPVEDEDITFEEAQRRRAEREQEQEKLMCSLQNKEACVMCSG